MRLAYHDIDGDPAAASAVVLHREAVIDTEAAVAVARAAGITGRVIGPYGDCAFYPSGMDIGGLCWYRVLPDERGADPVTVAKAVVQVADLMADARLERPVLLGWGQGAVVALGTALLPGSPAGAAVCVDPSVADIRCLPPAGGTDPGPTPPVLIVARDGSSRDHIAARVSEEDLPTVTVASWFVPGAGLRGTDGAVLGASVAGWRNQQEVAHP